MKLNMNHAVQSALLEDRVRIGAILESPLAEGRERLAAELALRTSMSAEAALDLLKAAPTASNNSGGNAFLRALEAEAIGLPAATAASVGADDPKAKRIAEIKANVNRKKGA